MRIRVLAKAASVVALMVAIIIGCLWYAFLGHHHATAQVRPAEFKSTADALQSTNASLILAAADHFFWLNNAPAAAPLYARAETLFSENGDKKNELHAHIGRLRCEAEHMSFVDLSHYLEAQLQTPMVAQDKRLRLWCLISKGYTDIEVDYRLAKRDWLEAQEIAKSLGDDEWSARASGELGLIGFMEGNPGRAARLMGTALLKTMASGDVGGQIRYLELLGRGFEEVNRHSEALRLFKRAINLAQGERDCGVPFMAYEGKAEALIGLGRQDDGKKVLEDTLAKARSQNNLGHEAQVLIFLGKATAQSGDKRQAIQYLDEAGRIATENQFSSLEADSMIESAKLYQELGDLHSADERATQALAASQRVGDRYYVPRNLSTLAELKASRGQVIEANALYEHAEDVIDGMLLTVDEPYWNSSLVASRSETYLHHFELLSRARDVSGSFRVIERVRGRTLAWALADKKSFPSADSAQTASLETKVSDVQTRLMQSNDATDRDHLLDQLAEYEQRLSFAWTKDHASKQSLPSQSVSLPMLKAELDEREALLEYVLDEPNSYCVAITKKGEKLWQLPVGRKQIETLAESYIAAIREKRDGSNTAKRLYDLLVKPVPETSAATRLIIVPDGVLNLLPFEALKDDGNEYLLRSHDVTYVPSATILDMLRRAEKRQLAPKPLLALGDVLYQDQGHAGRNLPKPVSLGARVERGVADLSGISLHDLPQTREEVEEIGKIVGRDSVVLLGKDATEDAFKKEPLDQFRILHLAVHGFADTKYPERSALVLGKDQNSTDDGLLQVPEIIRLKLNAELATLSACDTGVGKLQGEEGVSNLVEAFLVAGARSVVASLWSADDASASALMERFYQRLATGESVSSALRNAKLDMLSKFGNDLNPYYWAAFISVGETSTPVGITK